MTDYYKSMTVKEITEKDINQIYQLRELIELPAFKLIFDSEKYEEFSYRIEEKVVRMCAVASRSICMGDCGYCISYGNCKYL